MFKRVYLSVLILLAIIFWYFYFKDFTSYIPTSFYIYLDAWFIIILTLILTYLSTVLIDIFFTRWIFKIIKSDSLGKKFLPLVHNIINILVWFLWIFVLISLLGFNINTLVAWAWIWWVMIALASKEAVSNLVGSFTLVFSKAFKHWDYIKIKWFEWYVDEITLSYTRLIDKKWNYIYIQNKNIVSENIENTSQWKNKKLDINFLLPINIEIKTKNDFTKKLEDLLDKLIKVEKIISYKINLDSINEKSINYIINIENYRKDDNSAIKNEILTEIKVIYSKLNINFLT